MIVLKAVAHRPKDRQDILALLEMGYSFDCSRVLKIVREFADALEMPELHADLENLLSAGK